jgi:ribosomal protection tetracycline resistance protein
VALTQLAEQDPLINLRQDNGGRETSVSLYGEVQKEVIRDTLAEDFGIEVDFTGSTTICVERLVGSGTVVELLPNGRSPQSPYLAGVGLRVEPAALDSGTTVKLEIERGSLPRAFLKAIEESIPLGLRAGRYGWQVVDCTVTIVSSGYAPRQSHSHATFDKAMSSTAEDFRALTQLVLARAIRKAGTVVCEPIHRFHLDIPTEALGPVLPVLALLRAVPEAPEPRGSSYLLDGEIPAAEVHELRERLPALTRGEGVLECGFDHYRPVRGRAPSRPRQFTRMTV